MLFGQVSICLVKISPWDFCSGSTLVLDGAEPEVTEPVLRVLQVVLLWESSVYPGWHAGSYARISAVETGRAEGRISGYMCSTSSIGVFVDLESRFYGSVFSPPPRRACPGRTREVIP